MEKLYIESTGDEKVISDNSEINEDNTKTNAGTESTTREGVSTNPTSETAKKVKDNKEEKVINTFECRFDTWCKMQY